MKTIEKYYKAIVLIAIPVAYIYFAIGIMLNYTLLFVVAIAIMAVVVLLLMKYSTAEDPSAKEVFERLKRIQRRKRIKAALPEKRLSTTVYVDEDNQLKKIDYSELKRDLKADLKRLSI